MLVHTPIQCEMMMAKQGTAKTDIMVKDWWLAALHKSVSHVAQKSTFPFPLGHFETESDMAHRSPISLFAIEQLRNVCLFPDWSVTSVFWQANFKSGPSGTPWNPKILPKVSTPCFTTEAASCKTFLLHSVGSIPLLSIGSAHLGSSWELQT